MNKTECAEKAVSLKRSGYNCCQAVAVAIAEMEGVPSEDFLKLASGFGMGMGNMQATCGALVGAVIMAGKKAEGSGTVRFARQISESFKSKCGAVTCSELKGYPNGKVLCPCDQCVKNAVLCYCEVFNM